MTAPRRDDGRLGDGLAAILRVGTVVSVLVVGVGFIVAAMTGLPSRGGRPLLDVVLNAGPDAPVAVGLFLLTLLPAMTLGYAARSFAASGERRRMWTALAVLALLVASMVVAAVIGASI